MLDKAALREAARKVREVAFEASPHAAHDLAAHFLRAMRPGRVISGYSPIGSEIDIVPLLALLAVQGATLALPVVRKATRILEFRAWAPGDVLEAGVFGTRHPAPGAKIVTPDMLLVPLLAFDDTGHRLGYGGGYYDATLAALREAGSVTAVGCAFAAQRIASLPVESNDQRLDWLVTEQDALRFS
jgi:5-formyltetrahydrofolate cyclo-ligase